MENLLAKALSKEAAALVMVGVLLASMLFIGWQVYNHLPSQIAELKTDIKELKTDIKEDIQELKEDIRETNRRMERMEEKSEDRMERMEGSLLREIRRLRKGDD